MKLRSNGKPTRIAWPREVKRFIREYKGKLHNTELLKQVSVMMGREINMSTFRHQLERMGYRPNKLVHWTPGQTQFLLDNYQTMGNLELADKLNALKLSKRKFVKKHIEKKMVLLGLERTSEELRAIVESHKKRHRYPGRVKAHPEGAIRIWSVNGTPFEHIKINGTFTKYARHVYEQHHGPIPKGHMIVFKDCNTLNTDIRNLLVIPRKGMGKEYHRKIKRIANQNWNRLTLLKTKMEPTVSRPALRPQSHKIKVTIKPGLDIYVKPGTDLNEIYRKYDVPLKEQIRAIDNRI